MLNRFRMLLKLNMHLKAWYNQYVSWEKSCVSLYPEIKLSAVQNIAAPTALLLTSWANQGLEDDDKICYSRKQNDP